ncbi:hypothetical protein EYF80_004416 [Liparis tanakae]|uniref:Uncharacterized protein n=1 Tax=Liparis tanakae TaxID=230148 RepID=A0A4Z2J699_9TELE|nr:hypothetical protein EYF80_004416 [Liparis tanakae]
MTPAGSVQSLRFSLDVQSLDFNLAMSIAILHLLGKEEEEEGMKAKEVATSAPADVAGVYWRIVLGTNWVHMLTKQAAEGVMASQPVHGAINPEYITAGLEADPQYATSSVFVMLLIAIASSHLFLFTG